MTSRGERSMIKWISDNIKGVTVSAVALLLLANFGYSILAAKRIEGLQNEVKAIEEKATANAKAVEALRQFRQSDAAAIVTLQSGQIEISSRLTGTIKGMGRVSNESREILDTAIPDDISRLLNNGTTD